MVKTSLQKENVNVILQSILSANSKSLEIIKKQFVQFDEKQAYTALLLKLGYSFNETRILLESDTKSIKEIYDIINKTS